jgi:hypothetical protein
VNKLSTHHISFHNSTNIFTLSNEFVWQLECMN